MRLAFDEQIFAAQQYGGISRLFAELSKQFLREGSLEVELLPLDAPVVNRYLLDDPYLRDQLKVSDAGSTMAALARYFVRMRPRTSVDVIHNTFYLQHGPAHRTAEVGEGLDLTSVHRSSDRHPLSRLPTLDRRLC